MLDQIPYAYCWGEPNGCIDPSGFLAITHERPIPINGWPGAPQQVCGITPEWSTLGSFGRDVGQDAVEEILGGITETDGVGSAEGVAGTIGDGAVAAGRGIDIVAKEAATDQAMENDISDLCQEYIPPNNAAGYEHWRSSTPPRRRARRAPFLD